MFQNGGSRTQMINSCKRLAGLFLIHLKKPVCIIEKILLNVKRRQPTSAIIASLLLHFILYYRRIDITSAITCCDGEVRF